ncbi:lanthionine synthetase C family protein [Streptomyces sp. NPDC049555]|uniref:lanthionine synthetase C family protein n=1 Tax=unclassified Streptomyces TaxID=2593676 RepID=UPI00342A41CA
MNAPVSALRRRAAEVVALVAHRLADPAIGAAGAASAFRAAGLGDGAPGIALLHAELAYADPAHRSAAHRWLRHGAALVGRATVPAAQGLYGPVAALSFALHRAAEGHAAQGHLARQVAELAGLRADREERRLGMRPGERMGCTVLTAYDVISGQAGLGAHLLELGGPAPKAAAVRTVRALTALARPVRADGLLLPGWWVALDADAYRPVPPAQGHANLGTAHGLPGPLALLALAWRQGLRVPGQRAAITGFAEWLLAQRRTDAVGPWWPGQVTAGPAPSRPGRPSWCYGTPGIARALQLAGLALGVSRWQEAGVDALRAALARAASGEVEPAAEAGLCHGLAGLLQTTWRVARDSGDAELAGHLPWLAARLLDLVDEDRPYGFAEAPGARPPEEHPGGFLTGASGAALALHTFATDTAPDTRWDRALLLA